ncbi:MAG: hypothetical protein ACRD33_07905, partial [Candidatus Acidiferrales bacterium]
MSKERQGSSATTSAEPESHTSSRASSGIPSGTSLRGSSRAPSAAEIEWEKKILEPTLQKSPERAKEFTTISD